MTQDYQNWRPATRLVHCGTQRSGFMETSEAIFASSGFIYHSAEEAAAAFQADGLRYVYSRFRNPTVVMFEDRLAAYEGVPRCFATASGMAAVFATLMATLKAGDRIVAPYALFGSCLHIVKTILPQYGIQPILVDGTDLDQWERALRGGAAAVFIESPTNPTLDVLDLAAICQIGRAAGARIIVDNVFASPVLQRPIDLGADVVVYSATKHIDGQGRSLGGAILCDDAFAESLAPFLRHTGPTLSPFNAWVLLKGLETLELRVMAQSAAALRIASYLETRGDRVTRLRYPWLESHPAHDLARRQMRGGGTLVTWDMQGGTRAAFGCVNALRLIHISNNLGDSKSLVTHPETTTHARAAPEDRIRAGIGSGTLRLSVGLEDPADLIADLEQALAAVSS